MERITAPPARVLLTQAGLLPAPAPGAQAVILVTQILHDDSKGSGAAAAFKVTIADLNPTMIAKAEERIARNAGWEGRVDAVVADAQATKLPDAHFTHAIMNFGLQFMPDKIAALKETLRILKPGGVLGMTVWTSPGWLDSLIKGCPGWTTPPALVNPLGRPGIVEMLAAAGLPPSEG
uniref:Methyltransferase type 11 domain-containing protein n=1 Tax=Mycena chlorophos TaxID=658473 RepID=A0ABQ0L0I3_MYCCL|nr:predicted protein [Mycena chlorophos]